MTDLLNEITRSIDSEEYARAVSVSQLPNDDCTVSKSQHVRDSNVAFRREMVHVHVASTFRKAYGRASPHLPQSINTAPVGGSTHRTYFGTFLTESVAFVQGGRRAQS